MFQYDIALDKYWVTQSVYFRLSTTVALGMGITDGKLLYCHGVAEGNVEKKFQYWSTTTGRFVTASIRSIFNYMVIFSLIISTYNTPLSIVRNIKKLRSIY